MKYNKINILNMIKAEEDINKNTICLFLDDCILNNDIESIQLLVNSSQMFSLFLDDTIFYSYRHEMEIIMTHIASTNNIELIKKVLSYANDYTCDNDKLHRAGNFIVAQLYKNDSNNIAEQLIYEYHLNPGFIIVELYKIGYNYIQNMITTHNEYIQNMSVRHWLMTYCGRNNDISMINFLEQYYNYTQKDIFTILYNFSKSITYSENMYNFIFNKYINIIKNEIIEIKKLVKHLHSEERDNLMFIIFNNIKFEDTDLIELLTDIFEYEFFFEELINDITYIMLNKWNMTERQIKNVYNQINDEKVIKYIGDNFD